MKSIQQFLQKPWLYLIIILFGIAVKFYYIDYRFFWFDEVCTIMHVTGNTGMYYPENEIVNLKDFFKDKLHLKKANRSIAEEYRLISQATSLNPLHYYLLSLWYRVAGDDPVDLRRFSLIMFLLSLPVLFWLARFLFKSELAGWIAICLFSSSPYFHFFALEARYQILWTFIILLLHLIFLKAVEEDKSKWWISYIIVGILNLYVNPLSGLIILGHFIFILIINRRLWLRHTISSCLVVLGYLPWLILIVSRREEILESLSWHSWLGSNLSVFRLILIQLVYMAESIVSTGGFLKTLRTLQYLKLQGNLFQVIILLGMIVLIVYAFIYAFRKLSKKVSFFLILIILPQVLFFLISDLIRNMAGSYNPRYYVITFSGIILLMTALFYDKIRQKKQVYAAIFLILVLLGYLSILKNSKNRCWDTPHYCEAIINEAEFFKKAENPLYIFSTADINIEGTKLLTFINECDRNDMDILVVSPDKKNIKELIGDRHYSEIYVLHNSDEFIKNLKTEFGERMDSLEVDGIRAMWRININENNSVDN